MLELLHYQVYSVSTAYSVSLSYKNLPLLSPQIPVIHARLHVLRTSKWRVTTTCLHAIWTITIPQYDQNSMQYDVHVVDAYKFRNKFVHWIFICGSVHRNSILIRSNKMQQYAGIYLLQNLSTCFGCPSHPSSGVHETVTAAILQHGLKAKLEEGCCCDTMTCTRSCSYSFMYS